MGRELYYIKDQQENLERLVYISNEKKSWENSW